MMSRLLRARGLKQDVGFDEGPTQRRAYYGRVD